MMIVFTPAYLVKPAGRKLPERHATQFHGHGSHGMRKALFTIAILFSTVTPAWAWSAAGHKYIASIALPGYPQKNARRLLISSASIPGASRISPTNCRQK
jgi:hypothetical protein